MIDETPAPSPAPTRFRARSRWRLLPSLLLVLLFASARWWWAAEHKPVPPPPLLAEGEYAVVRVVDGDTLELAGDVRIRLLGVDTPETVHPDVPPEPWGAEAAEFTQQFCAAGPVRLTFDRERQDRYGRYLAFVWRGDELLNERLVAAGLSPAITKYPFSPAMKDRLRAAERDAKRKKLGLWSGPAPTAPSGSR